MKKAIIKNNNWIVGLQIVTGVIVLLAVGVWCHYNWDFLTHHIGD